jgi:Domain of Unknown Function (DUF1080)
MTNLKHTRRPVGPLLACALSLSLLAPAFVAAAEGEAEKAAAGGASLFNGKDLTGWKTRDAKAKEKWKVASQVAIDSGDPKKLVGTGEGGGEGAALVLEKSAGGADLISEKSFGDCELHVEVMYPKGSNSGIYLMGQYEVQVLDSAGKSKVGPGDLGGIYNTKAPSENAAKPAGEWQTFHIVFRAPRFEGGKKTENAKFVKVVLNGKTIHENVEAPKATGSELPGGEKPQGPLMFQGDHGPVAFRNVRVRATGERPAAEAAGAEDAKPAAGK